MKYSKSIILISLLIFIFNCKKEKYEDIIPMNQIATGSDYDSLYASASKGNCDAFFELYQDMMEYQDKSPILKLSKKTFEKNNDCEPALSAYFDSLCRKYDIRD